MKIAKLSQTLIDQIAAGEIIERPASVVKELLENSIDAGANKIVVKVLEGGAKLIVVSDNGSGIQKDDLGLAIENHATSKISTQEDLQNCESHGFRGEALAAIASVANVKIRSKVHNSETGFELVKTDGEWDVFLSPGHDGTDIFVEDLFHNVPARKRFLKNNTTEFKHCQAIFTQLSLVYPRIEFSLFHQGREVMLLRKSSELGRFAEIFELKEEQVKATTKQFEDLKIKVFISTNQEASKKIPFFVYVNNRPIKNSTISYAIKNAFKNRIHELHKPYMLIFITIPNYYINFNVHPNKKEVYFKQNSNIYKAVYSIICDSLSSNDPSQRSNKLVFSSSKIQDNNKTEINRGFELNSLTDNHLFPKLEQIFSNPTLLEGSNENSVEHKLGYPIGQLNDTYILAQNTRGLLIIDTHAAHERILLEDLKKNNNQLNCQKLTIPECIGFDEGNLKLLKNRIEIINQFGFQVKIVGEATLIIEGIPEILAGKKYTVALHDIVEGILHSECVSNITETVDEILGNIACKSAIKANRKLSIAEIEYILRKIELTTNGGICNHGRPTWIELSMKSLDKLFYRGK
ncbi:DNA mismatch repair endonuclease MutL [Betaproteobacteria bacterium]|nr:DNA mismatch repair endonuclease MutL [Betaproteobacteria bacterium]